jgi:uncharacterized protein
MSVWSIVSCICMLVCLADVLVSDSSGGIGIGSADPTTPALIQHIIDNDLDAAYDLIAMGDSPNVKELPSGWTPLIYAASAGNAELAKHLILAGADVNQGCTDGWTPLMFACVHGKLSTIEVLLNYGSNIHQVSSNGATALGCAKLGGFPEVISLIEASLHADRLNEIFCDKNGIESVILSASHTSDVPLIRRLLREGHSPNTVSSGGWTPLMLSAAAGCAPCLQLLLDAGAEVDHQDHDGWTALMFCAHSGAAEAVRVLVAAGADVLLTNHDQFNSLHLSRAEGHLEAFHAMVARSFCGELRAMERMMLMIEDGVDPNYVCADVSNYTPLIVAVKAQDEAAVAALLSDERVNVNAVERDHWSPLMFASLRGSEAIIRRLLLRGADRDLVTTQGYSVIRLAQMYNQDNDVVLGMLENGLEFTDSPSVYKESEPTKPKHSNQKDKDSYAKHVGVDVIKKSSPDSASSSEKSWSSLFSDLKRGRGRGADKGPAVRQYLHTPVTAERSGGQGQGEGKARGKSVLESLFGWL